MLTCAKCVHKKSLATDVSSAMPVKFCLRYPPSTHILVQTDKFGQQVGFANSYPSITDQTTACGEYSENIKLSN